LPGASPQCGSDLGHLAQPRQLSSQARYASTPLRASDDGSTDGRHKYVWRTADGAEQLFDIDRDPREEHDLAHAGGDPAMVQQWRGRLVRELRNRLEGFTDGEKLVPGRAYPPVMKGRGQPPG
jgi:hypothetical protein